MAIKIDDFDKIWASTSPLTPYEFSESNYKEGWNFIGSTPPARQMWDFIQKQNDEKLKYLLDNFGDYAKKTDLDDYLPLAGGTITGTIVDANGSNTFIVNSVDNLYTQINGGTEQSKGAWLRLNGKDNVGSFQVRANDGTNESILSGRPDGTLTWVGKTIIVGTEYSEDFSTGSINAGQTKSIGTLSHVPKYWSVNINTGSGWGELVVNVNGAGSVYAKNTSTTNRPDGFNFAINYIV